MSTASQLKGKAKATLIDTAGDHPTGVASSETHTESESDSSASSDETDDETESEEDSDDDISQEYLESLLEQARQNARAKQLAKAADPSRTFADGDDVLQLHAEPELPKIPSLNPGRLPPSYIESSEAGPSKFRNVDAEMAEKASERLSAPAPPPPPTVPLSKKQRQTLKNKTAGKNWFDLPAPAEADLPRLHREVEALRLRNQLDPKRFYRKDEGEGKGIKGLPKHFAIGTIVATRSPFAQGTGDNLARGPRKRTLVDELVDDAEAQSYAKKKFKDLQTVRGARGRGTLAKKQAQRRQKW